MLQVSHECVRHLLSWNALMHYSVHMFAWKKCILCSALHHKSYLTLLCLETFAQGFMAVVSQLLGNDYPGLQKV